jgi:hypothetical protein
MDEKEELGNWINSVVSFELPYLVSNENLPHMPEKELYEILWIFC